MSVASDDSSPLEEFDYIVVGSGAGGAPLAARLAQAQYRVLVIEAGSDTVDLLPQTPAHEVSEVPALHAVSSEHPDLSWQFFVKHFDNYPGGQPDPKWHEPDTAKGEDETHRGIFYPRAAALGGCTVHNAMITIAGPDSDWDDLADFIDDDSWRSNVMRPYFQKLERNEYFPKPPLPPTYWWGHWVNRLRWLFNFAPDYTGGLHGFDKSTSWLTTSLADPSQGIKDPQLIGMITAALTQSAKSGLEDFGADADHFIHNKLNESLDPNHAWRQAHHPEGLIQIPLAVHKKPFVPGPNDPRPARQPGHRSSPRDLLRQVKAAYPDRLTIWTECLVTKVILSEGEPLRALGVEYLKGKHLYAAHPVEVQNPGAGEPGKVLAKREVILCGGSFNTPQLLMLSGIGDREHLEQFGITCRRHSPGVGCNLHDRYEVTVISEMREDFSVLAGADFRLPPADGSSTDAQFARWRKDGSGLYSSNGSVLGIFKRSNPELPQPDLFIFGLPLSFPGYEVGYSKDPKHNFFTWAILKAHTQNRDGTVRLRSTDPRATPEINFHYFRERTRTMQAEEHPDPAGQGTLAQQVASEQMQDPDLQALVDGVKFVNGIGKLAGLVVKQRVHPTQTEIENIDDPKLDQQLKEWIAREAWGHHACGSCRMGPDADTRAVLDSRCAVRGVAGLRVVDASIFPKIPGYFIVTNIYIASEKIADDILREATVGNTDSEAYPAELRNRESEAIARRRAEVPPNPAIPAGPVFAPLEGTPPQWPEDVTGLAISGGGVRSATIHLGVLQALARAHVLRRIDFMSTVSGGGYVGSFLGRFFDRLRADPLSGAGRHSAQPAADRVEHELVAPDSKEIGWLRAHGNYLAPGGNGDVRFNLALFLRNFLSVHFVSGMLVLAAFGLANIVRYAFFDPAAAAAGVVTGNGGASILPLGYLAEITLGKTWGVFWSPWFVLFELLLLFLVVPRLLGFWIASQDHHERYDWPALSLLFIFLCMLLYLSVRQGFAPQPFFGALSLASSFIAVELAWVHGRRQEEATGTGSVKSQRLRTRNCLTADLGLALAGAGAALAFAVADAIGHALQQWLVANNISYGRAFTGFGVALTALMPMLRGLAGYVSGTKSSGPPSTLERLLKHTVTAGLLALVLSAVPLIFYSFLSHATFLGGTAFGTGLAATLLALLVSCILANKDALPFVNRSSLEAVYASHIARTYLGASNPLRHHPAGANIKAVMPEDDVDSIQNYQPHAAGGPLHLINVTVNQTIDFHSGHGNRDRKGENMAVTSLGVSIGSRWHAIWKPAAATPSASASGPGAQTAEQPSVAAIDPIGWRQGSTHPLVGETGVASTEAEMLPLRDWIGISGAAIGPARGQTTALGTALLFGLANLRTGYWWDSGIHDSMREGFPQMTFMRRLLHLVPGVFLTQSLLLFEWVARFAGPWERFWNLSDGGFFENLAAYELVRRRVPRMIVGDGGADPDYQFEDFANLVRKARIDFGARIDPLPPADWTALGIPAGVQKQLGSLTDLRPVVDASGNVVRRSRHHAALFQVTYEDGRCPYKSLLLYLKASCTNAEAVDVTSYTALHPDFPHESTADQFFNEAQWESYRKLGEDTGAKLFGGAGDSANWFWTMHLPG